MKNKFTTEQQGVIKLRAAASTLGLKAGSVYAEMTPEKLAWLKVNIPHNEFGEAEMSIFAYLVGPILDDLIAGES